MTKIPKKAQVAFNQFIFDTMMQKLRDVELLEKKVTAHEELLKVHIQDISELGRQFATQERRVTYFTTEVTRMINEDREHIETLQIQMKNLLSSNNGLTNAVLKIQNEKKKKSGRPKNNNQFYFS